MIGSEGTKIIHGCGYELERQISQSWLVELKK